MIGIIVREAWHRRVTSLLSMVAVGVGVAMVLVLVAITRGAEDETRIIQRDMGLNLVILPPGSLDRYWTFGYAEGSMPASYIGALESQDVANRMIPMLRRRVTWQGAEVMLTGIAPEVFARGDTKKRVMGVDVEPGTLVVGSEVARTLDLSESDEVDLLGTPFTIATILRGEGSVDDATVFANLADAQSVLGMPDRINEIHAIECHCAEDVDDPLAFIRTQLQPVIPDAQVLRKEDMADARRRQRAMASHLTTTVTPIVLLVASAWLCTLAVMNVQSRRREIGILQALGFGPVRLGVVFLGRAILLGCLGALVGLAASAIALPSLATAVFRIAPKFATLDNDVVLLVLVGAPSLAAIVCLVPTLLAATQDPVVGLREDDT